MNTKQKGTAQKRLEKAVDSAYWRVYHHLTDGRLEVDWGIVDDLDYIHTKALEGIEAEFR